MCGIAGYIMFSGFVKDTTIIQKMTETLYHRGPDDAGTKLFGHSDYELALGQRRLSILDLTESGHQPMNYKHLWTVYNGEVYNFKDIRDELMGLGHSFTSQSDTEVILHAFEQWNVRAVDKFIGMFAFAIYNEREDVFYIFRDRAGVKPLHYYSNNDASVFMFASELKYLPQAPLF
ncbi:MAG: hypothetical protein R2783_07420 [Gelidibacter sp.]